MSGVRHFPIRLQQDEWEQLTKLANSPRTPQATALRAHIILGCAKESSIERVANNLNISRYTVSKWRERFLRRRLAGLADSPRTGRPRTVNQVELRTVVDLMVNRPAPADAPRWSTRRMARVTGLSPSAVGRVWRELGIRPDPSPEPLDRDGFLLADLGSPLRPRLLVRAISAADDDDRRSPGLPPPSLHVRVVRTELGRSDLMMIFQAGTDMGVAKVDAERCVEHLLRRLRWAAQFAAPHHLIHVVVDRPELVRDPAVLHWARSAAHSLIHIVPSDVWSELARLWLTDEAWCQAGDGAHALLDACTAAARSYAHDVVPGYNWGSAWLMRFGRVHQITASAC